METETIVRVENKLNEITQLDDTPAWASILITCVSDLVVEIKKINNLTERICKLEDISNVRESIIGKLKVENAKLKSDIVTMKQSIDSNEQKSRNICLLLHGIPESDNDNTDDLVVKVINDDVGVHITIDDIERTHRIGPTKSISTRRTKPRAIIVRFASMRKRIDVYKNKKNLKGKKILLTESLTASRFNLLNKAKEKFGQRNVWTAEGRIFTQIDGKLVHISSEGDL